MTASALEFKPESANSLMKEVMERSGQNLTACYQCRRCAAGCPVGEETGFVTPDLLIRMVAFGDREQALNNQLVWKCVSCYTCGTRCPNEIQTARITETIKKMSKEAHLEALNHKVAHFHKSFTDAGLGRGRVNEMAFMTFYEIKNAITEIKKLNFNNIYRELKQQSKLGLSLHKLKRMHFGFQSAKGRKELKRLYKMQDKIRG